MLIRILLGAVLILGVATAHATPPTDASAEASTTTAATVATASAPATAEPPVLTMDQRIDAKVRPVADFISGLIFYSVAFDTKAGPVDFPLIVGWLILGGLIATFYFRFINISGFGHGLELIKGRYSDKSAPGEVSHFQALTSAVSGTVGLGNIAGVAVAITVGGPGATFWMIVAGLMGMSSKFVECTLGVMYRLEKADGTVSGGPMYYLSRGIAENYPDMKWFGNGLAYVFAFCTMAGAIGAGCMFQANQSYAQMLNITGGEAGPLGGNGWLFGLGIAILAGAVLIGGITRIGSVTAKLVPGMAIFYLLGGLVVLGVNIENIPEALAAIWNGAFTAEGVKGGILGALIAGFRRAYFSNEAGLGSAAIAHSAVKTREPLTEGFVALWEPFVDTVVICTMTALVIVITKQHHIVGVDGVQLTSNAFATVSSWFPLGLTIAVFLFAFSTIITWGYYGAKACSFVFRESKLALYVFKFFFLSMAVVGCTMQLGSIVDIADALIFIMAIPNLIGVYMLMPVVKRHLISYQNRRASGEIRPTSGPGSMAVGESTPEAP